MVAADKDKALEALLKYEGQVIEPVSSEGQRFHRFWRAAHLGNIALQLLNSSDVFNYHKADVAYFWDNYESAKNTAQSIISGERLTQFDKLNEQELQTLIPIPDNFAYPAMVVALKSPIKPGYRLQKIPPFDPFGEEIFDLGTLKTPLAFGGGYILKEPLRLHLLDPYSSGMIKQLFGLPHWTGRDINPKK